MFPVVLETTTSIHPTLLVLLLAPKERNGETMNAYAPKHNGMTMVHAQLVQEIQQEMMPKMVANAKLDMHLNQQTVTTMVANSNPTLTKKLLIRIVTV